MTRRDVQVETGDGSVTATLHVPEGAGPWPAVLVFHDAGGLRDVFRDMGDQLADRGYLALVPDLFYRAGTYPPFDMRTVFSDPAERARLKALSSSVTVDMAVRDARAHVDYLTSLPVTAGNAIGTTGYCQGGRLSLTVAGRLGDRIAAAASFHGGNLAPAGNPDSPHLLAARTTARIYVAGATDDPSFPAEQRDRLGRALTDAGVTHAIETYPAAHGFAVRDNPTHDPVAEQRHWRALEDLYRATWGTAEASRPDR